MIHQLREVLYSFVCVQQNFVFSITTSPEGKKNTRVDIPYPGNKGEIQDGHQDRRGYLDCTISTIILHTKVDLYVNSYVLGQ